MYAALECKRTMTCFSIGSSIVQVLFVFKFIYVCLRNVNKYYRKIKLIIIIFNQSYSYILYILLTLNKFDTVFFCIYRTVNRLLEQISIIFLVLFLLSLNRFHTVLFLFVNFEQILYIVLVSLMGFMTDVEQISHVLLQSQQTHDVVSTYIRRLYDVSVVVQASYRR